MPQVTIYLPDELAAQLRREARKEKKSLSAYIADLARRRRGGEWPKNFERLYGSWEGDFPVPEDPPADDVTGL